VAGSARRLGGWLSAAAAVALVLYPVLIYLGSGRLGAGAIAVAVIAVCTVRLLAVRRSGGLLGRAQLALASVGGIALAAVSLAHRSADAMLFYPALVNGVLLAAFATSLVRPPTVIERIARWRDPGLPPEARPYLEGVTVAWCVFFICNGAAALYTALYASLATWAFYNGVLAYVLIGAMFGAELLARRRFMRSLGK
jgi:uncharacterized membrane protein